MRNPRALASALLVLLLVSGASRVDEAGLRRCRGIADNAARLACYDALSIPTGTARPEPASAAPSAPPVPERAPLEQFGLEDRARPATQAETIDSRIPGRFEGWRPRSLIRLANGQVWQIADDTARTLQLDDPKVTVRRGMLGAFYLDIEGDNRSPRVRRVQ